MCSGTMQFNVSSVKVKRVRQFHFPGLVIHDKGDHDVHWFYCGCHQCGMYFRWWLEAFYRYTIFPFL